MRRPDLTSLVAGLSVTVVAVVLLLDRADAIDLRFDYAAPLVTAAVGAILLTAGLEGRRDRG
jgi:hypothetical protein